MTIRPFREKGTLKDHIYKVGEGLSLVSYRRSEIVIEIWKMSENHIKGHDDFQERVACQRAQDYNVDITCTMLLLSPQ